MKFSSTFPKFLSRKTTLVIVLSFLIIAMLFSNGTLPSPLLTSSYSTMFEGAKAKYIGVRDWVSGLSYTSTQKYSASLATFGTTMKFDRDGATEWSCNVHGEMTAVQIPETQDFFVPPSWVPREWWVNDRYIANPKNIYQWIIDNPNDTITAFQMEEWTTKWYISLSAEYDSGPDILAGFDEAQNRRYNNLEVWFEFDINPVWYWKSQPVTYFSIGKIELTIFKTEYRDVNGNIHKLTDPIRVDPMSSGSILTIYTTLFGEEESTVDAEFKSYYTQGLMLNPLYFRDKVYAFINLADFGTRDWFVFGGLAAAGDVVTMGFTVTQFVVGQWTVKDIGNLPEDYGRSSKQAIQGWDISAMLASWWNGISIWSWLGLGGFFLAAIGIVVVVVLVYFMGVPVWLFRRRQKPE